jgi:4-hydroxybenzoate polyprenyltransferase
MKPTFFVKISRPKTWIYLLYPYVLGIVFGYVGPPINLIAVVLAGLFFTFPANFLIHAVEDLFDFPLHSKNSIRSKQKIIYVILYAMIALTAGLALVINWYAWFGLIGFLLLAICYSTPPIRAKEYPILSNVFGARYIFPFIVGYGLVADQFPPTQVVVAGIIWTMATLAFLSANSIDRDTKVHSATIATLLGFTPTILLCFICYLLSCVLTFEWFGLFSVFSALLYCGLMTVVLNAQVKKTVLKYFSIINASVLAALIIWILLVVK